MKKKHKEYDANSIETLTMIANGILRSRQESTGADLGDVAWFISTYLEKEELAVLINHLTKLHSKKK